MGFGFKFVAAGLTVGVLWGAVPVHGQSASPGQGLIEIPQRVSEFLAFCQVHGETCSNYTLAISEALQKGAGGPRSRGYCPPDEVSVAAMTDRVRRWMMLRPETHALATNRTVADALISMFPCRGSREGSAATKTPGKGEPTAGSEKKTN